VEGMKAEGRTYKGVLFAGVLLDGWCVFLQHDQHSQKHWECKCWSSIVEWEIQKLKLFYHFWTAIWRKFCNLVSMEAYPLRAFGGNKEPRVPLLCSPQKGTQVNTRSLSMWIVCEMRTRRGKKLVWKNPVFRMWWCFMQVTMFGFGNNWLNQAQC
jgi:hypothetical protein